MTLVLFRTRRRDECLRLKGTARRRVRKSRQKEAAGAADAGLMLGRIYTRSIRAASVIIPCWALGGVMVGHRKITCALHLWCFRFTRLMTYLGSPLRLV